jgi:hypothetical protein
MRGSLSLEKKVGYGRRWMAETAISRFKALLENISSPGSRDGWTQSWRSRLSYTTCF